MIDVWLGAVHIVHFTTPANVASRAFSDMISPDAVRSVTVFPETNIRTTPSPPAKISLACVRQRKGFSRLACLMQWL